MANTTNMDVMLTQDKYPIKTMEFSQPWAGEWLVEPAMEHSKEGPEEKVRYRVNSAAKILRQAGLPGG